METQEAATRLSRREALGVCAAAVATAAMATTAVAAAAPERPTLHRYSSYGWLRGLNCIPSWGARIEEAWWKYHPGRFREEVALVRRIHGNCVRLWIEYTAWMADPDQVTAHFLDAVDAIDEAGMKTMPCLFNTWHDARWDYGGTYAFPADLKPHRDYVESLVRPLAASPAVLIWDLCNEPQSRAPGTPEHAWLAAIAQVVREAGARQPITIGTMTGDNVLAFAGIADVLCGHPYARDRDGLAQLIESFRVMAAQAGKPFLVNECVPGCLDGRKRGELARSYAELLPAAGFGWMGWSITEGKAVATRRDRIDGNGIDGQGFHAWFTREGRLREGLEFLLERPPLRAPWEKD